MTDTPPFVPPKLSRGLKKPPMNSSGSSEHIEPNSFNFSPQAAKEALVPPPTQILSFLFLGSQGNAASTKVLNQHSITRVLSLKERHTAAEHTSSQYTLLAVPMSDHGDTEISEVLPECFEFIDQSKSMSTVCLVHWYEFTLILFFLFYRDVAQHFVFETSFTTQLIVFKFSLKKISFLYF